MGCAEVVNGAEGKACIDRHRSSPADAHMCATDKDVLAYLGYPRATLLGAGGEAQVYALNDAHIVRILHAGALPSDAEHRASVLAEIKTGARHLRFQIPSVDSVQAWNGRVFSIEPRLSGQPVSQLLKTMSGIDRSNLLIDYLNVARQIRSISLNRSGYGPLRHELSLSTTSWKEFLRARLEWSLVRCPTDLRSAVAATLGVGLPEPAHPALLHIDYFPANVLAEGSTVKAVLDFGPSTIMGDARMEAWSAVAYLDSEMSPDATEADRDVAMAWLADQDLMENYPDAKRWLAGYWSFAADDPALMRWCRRILASD